jgi:ankyrin repeat protein
VFFENSEALMTHLQDHHGMDVRVSNVTCPLCVDFTSGDSDVLSLHIAHHMEEIALAILPSGVDSDKESADNSTSDATSIKDDDISQTQCHERLKDPDDAKYPSSPTLHHHDPAASHEGLEQVVKTLLDKDADVNVQGKEYKDAALQTASLQGHKQAVQMLLSAGADPNIREEDYSTALQAASYRGHESIVGLLLAAGADPNAQGGEYDTALKGASLSGHKQVVQMLLNAGALPHQERNPVLRQE